MAENSITNNPTPSNVRAGNTGATDSGVHPPAGGLPEGEYSLKDAYALEQAVRALRVWQAQEDRAGANRHGRCLEAVRRALRTVGLPLPPPQARPNNLALYNFQLLRQDAARWGWQAAPPRSRFTLDYFAHVGRLPDGRVAGHIALADHVAGVLYSSWDYPLTPHWQAVRVGSFVPRRPGTAQVPVVQASVAQASGNPAVSRQGSPASDGPLVGQDSPTQDPPGGPRKSFYIDLKVFEEGTGALLHHLPACALLASDGHAYLQARVAGEALDVACQVNDAHHEGLLIFRRATLPPKGQ